MTAAAVAAAKLALHDAHRTSASSTQLFPTAYSPHKEQTLHLSRDARPAGSATSQGSQSQADQRAKARSNIAVSKLSTWPKSALCKPALAGSTDASSHSTEAVRPLETRPKKVHFAMHKNCQIVYTSLLPGSASQSDNKSHPPPAQVDVSPLPGANERAAVPPASSSKPHQAMPNSYAAPATNQKDPGWTNVIAPRPGRHRVQAPANHEDGF
jgi:hypothetical protein